MARQQVLNPPVSYISDADMRTLGFHNYQVFDIANGSGDPSVQPTSDQLGVENVTGSGPLYDLDLLYQDAHPSSGVQLVQIGDNLLVAETESPPVIPYEPCWYRYYIRDIINDMGSDSGRFRVEYITDTCDGFGDQAPDQLCYDDTGTGGYGGTCNDSRIVVYRELNPEFLLGD